MEFLSFSKHNKKKIELQHGYDLYFYNGLLTPKQKPYQYSQSHLPSHIIIIMTTIIIKLAILCMITIPLHINSKNSNDNPLCDRLSAPTLKQNLSQLWLGIPNSQGNTLFFLIACPILAVLQLSLFATFRLYPELLQRPGNIFYYLIIIEFGLNTHLLVNAVYLFVNKNENQSMPTYFQQFCLGTGVLQTFLQLNHFCYLFFFLLYMIFLVKYSLKRKSQAFYNAIHISALILCTLITLFLTIDNFISLNLYRFCGVSLLLKSQQSPFLYIFSSTFLLLLIFMFIFLGLYSISYYRKHMPDQGQLKQRKQRYSQFILLYVVGFAVFQAVLNIFDVVLNKSCQIQSSLQEYTGIISAGNIVRISQYYFTIFLLLLNIRTRRKFKFVLRNLFVRKQTNNIELEAIDSPVRANFQMEQIICNQKLLQIRERSKQIQLVDVIYINQIFTIISGLYVIFWEYYKKGESKINKKKSKYKNISNGAHNQQQQLLNQQQFKLQPQDITEQQQQQLKPINFKQSIMLQIDNQSMKTYQPQKRQMIKLYALKSRLIFNYPQIFLNLIQMDGISNVHQSFKIFENVSKIWNMVDGQGGKSGQFFYFSPDRKFVLKTINDEEYIFLKNHVQQFYNHFKKNPQSLIAKIYGLFIIEGQHVQRTYRLILMKNITGCKKQQIRRVYDLKGSKYDREVVRSQVSDNQLRELTLKDIDFQKYQANKLHISPQKLHKLKQILKKDSQFLRKLNLIDYSLLIVKIKWQQLPVNPYFWHQLQRISNESQKYQYYHIGIIDYLQIWDFQKKSQNCFKKLIAKKQDISAVSPKKYSNRFIKFIQSLNNQSNNTVDVGLDSRDSYSPNHSQKKNSNQLQLLQREEATQQLQQNNKV